MARPGSLLRIRICRLIYFYVQYAIFVDGRLSRPRLLALLLTTSAFIGLFLCWREISAISKWGTQWHVSDRVIAYLTSRNRLDMMGTYQFWFSHDLPYNILYKCTVHKSTLSRLRQLEYSCIFCILYTLNRRINAEVVSQF